MKRPRIHREGRNMIIIIVLLLFIINIPVYMYFSHWVFGVTLILTATLLVFVTYFFRNPVRVLEIDDPGTPSRETSSSPSIRKAITKVHGCLSPAPRTSARSSSSRRLRKSRSPCGRSPEPWHDASSPTPSPDIRRIATPISALSNSVAAWTCTYRSIRRCSSPSEKPCAVMRPS